MPSIPDLITQISGQYAAEAKASQALADQNADLTKQLAAMTAQRDQLQAQLANQPSSNDPTTVGFKQVGKENDVFDCGASTYDLAYGAGSRFTYKLSMTGKVTFNNATFGDPANGAAKLGYAKLSAVQPTPQPAPQPAPTPPAVISHMSGTISDVGTPAQVAAYINSLGFKSIRIWAGLTEGGDCDQSTLNNANSYLTMGITPRLVLTPPYEGKTIPPYPTGAIAKIKASLDKRVVINLVNEPNNGDYWPGNDWMGAFKWADAVAADLRSAGFKIGSPSLVGWEDEWTTWWGQIIAAGYHKNFDWLVVHNYPNINPMTDAAGFTARFDKTNQEARAIADKLTSLLGRTINLDVDEWGLGEFISDDVFASTLPALQTSLNRYTNNSAYFIVSRSGTVAQPRLPHDNFNWAIDFATGQGRPVVVAALKAALSMK